MTTGTIFDIKRFAIHDGPGIRTTVFLKGCPLQCWWCHNPESQSFTRELLVRRSLCVACGQCVTACPEEVLVLGEAGIALDRARCTTGGGCVAACPSGALEMAGRTLSADGLMAEIERDVLFFDESGGGVTFSGGEPLAQADFLVDVLDRCGAHDIHRVVDTSGYADEEVVRRVAARTDLWLYDLKVMDPARHREVTGVPNASILENLRVLVDLGARVQVRLPVIPGVTDTEDNVIAVAAFLGSLDPSPPVVLLPHHPEAMDKYERIGMTCRLSAVAAPDADHLEMLAELMLPQGLDVRTG